MDVPFLTVWSQWELASVVLPIAVWLPVSTFLPCKSLQKQTTGAASCCCHLSITGWTRVVCAWAQQRPGVMVRMPTLGCPFWACAGVLWYCSLPHRVVLCPHGWPAGLQCPPCVSVCQCRLTKGGPGAPSERVQPRRPASGPRLSERTFESNSHVPFFSYLLSIVVYVEGLLARLAKRLCWNKCGGVSFKCTFISELNGEWDGDPLEADGPLKISGLVLCNMRVPRIFTSPRSTEVLSCEVKRLSWDFPICIMPSL